MGTFFRLRRPSWARRFTLLAAAVVGALTLATAAAAETTVITHAPFSSPGFNPCTGEALVVDGYQHFKVHLSFDETGTLHFSLEHNFQDTKALSVTGHRYVMMSTFTDHQNGVPPKNINVELITQFIRQKEIDGQLVLDVEDDFWARIKVAYVVNASGVVTVDRFEFTTECK